MRLFSWLRHATYTQRAKTFAYAVAVMSFIASFNHTAQLGYRFGESVVGFILAPLIIDTTIVVGIYVGLAAAEKGKKRGIRSWLILWVGGGATIATNIASSGDSIGAKFYSAIPPVFLILTIEVLSYLVEKVSRPEPEPVKPMTAAEIVRANPSMTAEEIVTATGVTPYHAKRLLTKYGTKPNQG